MRCTYRALRSVALRPALVDIYKLISPSADELTEFGSACTDRLSAVNVFHINGDEVDQAVAHLSYQRPWSGYNIVYPAWELARYPEVWAVQLDRFDEIWAPSRFIQKAIESVCRRPVIHMPLACEVLLSSFLSRRFFGISETEYVFLFFFDVRSYPNRKNPRGVIHAFRRLLLLRPFAKTRLILKVNGAELDRLSMEQLLHDLDGISSHVTLLCQVMSDNEVKNLIRCCDCFISLHRAEGYGRGIAEAMYLGKPVIATAYSGNMDFMTNDTSLEVGYQLVAVGNGEYPHWQDQLWADPDLEQAVRHMITLVDTPSLGLKLGRRAEVYIRTNFSYRSAGMRYRERIEYIARDKVAELA